MLENSVEIRRRAVSCNPPAVEAGVLKKLRVSSSVFSRVGMKGDSSSNGGMTSFGMMCYDGLQKPVNSMMYYDFTGRGTLGPMLACDDVSLESVLDDGTINRVVIDG